LTASPQKLGQGRKLQCLIVAAHDAQQPQDMKMEILSDMHTDMHISLPKSLHEKYKWVEIGK